MTLANPRFFLDQRHIPVRKRGFELRICFDAFGKMNGDGAKLSVGH